MNYAAKKSLRHENVGRLGISMIGPSADVRGVDYTSKRASPLTYLIEQITRLALILFVSYALLVDVADKLDVELLQMQSRIDQVEVGVIKALTLSYYHQMPFLLLAVVIVILRLVTLRGDRFLEPSKRAEVTFLKMLISYMALLFLSKLWVSYLDSFARGVSVSMAQQDIALSELNVLLYLGGALGLGAFLFVFRSVRENPIKALLAACPLVILAIYYAFETAISSVGFFSAGFLRTSTEGFWAELVRVVSALM